MVGIFLTSNTDVLKLVNFSRKLKGNMSIYTALLQHKLGKSGSVSMPSIPIITIGLYFTVSRPHHQRMSLPGLRTVLSLQSL